MPSKFSFETEGIADAEKLVLGLDDKVNRCARQAVNKTLDRTRTAIAREMLEEVNWPRSYLAPSNGRFVVAHYASGDNLKGMIRGRDEPTSLARFSSGGKPGKAGLKVSVERGKTKTLSKAFLMKLRNGNMGLAIRLPNGVSPRAAYKPKRLKGGLWLLYGPSVDQAFRVILERTTVVKEAGDFLETEYLRLMELRK